VRSLGVILGKLPSPIFCVVRELSPRILPLQIGFLWLRGSDTLSTPAIFFPAVAAAIASGDELIRAESDTSTYSIFIRRFANM